MWDSIEKMASDRLWIYTGIAGALFGAAFLAYFRGTRAGLWCYSKFDRVLDYLINRLGWTWLKQPEDAWRKKYPHVTKKIDNLEKRLRQIELMSHEHKRKIRRLAKSVD